MSDLLVNNLQYMTEAHRPPRAAHSFNIRLQDERVHAYAQRYTFLNGPDGALNAALRVAVRESARPLADEQDDARINFLDARAQREFEAPLLEQLVVPPELRLDRETIVAWIKNLAWKVAAIPQDARSVLVLGSDSCREAIFIRHRLPRAKIVCTDFVDKRLPNIERALDTTFYEGDFHALLDRNPGTFDVVFSNHVLEHLFDPGKTLRSIKHSLTPNGCMVAALPLDGQPHVPFSMALNTSALHPLDMCTIDVAHAWKTNVTVLLQELGAAGFAECTFAGRQRHYSLADREFSDRHAFERRARLGLFLNRAVFGTLRAVLKHIFPKTVPRLVLKVVFGIEHRVWFGSNPLKNEFSIECLVVAKQ